MKMMAGREEGQTSVEYAVVFVGFLSVIIALGFMGNAIGDGLLVEHALQVASHHVVAVVPGVICDVFFF